MPSEVTLTGPGTATIVDDAAAAIELQTAAFEPVLIQIVNQLGNLGKANINLKNEIRGLTDAVEGLKATVAGIPAAAASTNAILAMAAANQIKTNNFQMQATKDALARTGQPEPVMPGQKEQMTEGVKESTVLMEVGMAQGFAVAQINTMLNSGLVFVQGILPTWKQVTKFFDFAEKQAATLNPNLPPNPKDILDSTNMTTGTPTTLA